MHDEEHSYVPLPSYQMEAYRYSVIPGACTGTPSGYYSIDMGEASGIRRGRCATQLTNVDPTGWRPPTPYWAYEWRFTDRPDVGRPLYKSYAGQTVSYGSSPRPQAEFSFVEVGFANKDEFAQYRPYFADLEALAITEALAELGQATAEAAVDLVEARKTAEMLGSTFEELWRDVRYVWRRQVPPRWKKTVRSIRRDPIHWASKTFPERWMEGRYGWQPLVLSAFDYMKLLDEQSSRPMLVTARKRQDDASVSSVLSVNNWEGAYWTIPVVVNRRRTETKSVYVVLTMSVNDVERMTANDAGMLNPASVLWEALPFSWMADWVANVGDYLNARSALEFLSLKGGTATHRHEWTNERWWQPWDGGNPQHVWCTEPLSTPAIAGGHSFQRRVVTSLSPSLAWRSEINLTRALDAVSLLATAFSGKSVMGLRV